VDDIEAPVVELFAKDFPKNDRQGLSKRVLSKGVQDFISPQHIKKKVSHTTSYLHSMKASLGQRILHCLHSVQENAVDPVLDSE